jgi:hypothetical protein
LEENAHQGLKNLVENHEKLGDHIQGAILALWKFCVNSPHLRAHTHEVHHHLDQALEVFQNCSTELSRVTGEERKSG